jgi:phage/plasmid primase-like uncharacterized protein
MTKSNLFFEEELLESRKLRKPIKILSEKEEDILLKNKSLFSIKRSPHFIKKNIIQVYNKDKNNTKKIQQNNVANKENKIKKLVIKIAPLKDAPKTKRNQFTQIVYFSRIEKKEESKELARINKDTFLYDKNNKIVSSKEDMKKIADDWFNFKYKKKNEEISRHIVFSIGGKEDKQKILDMSAKFFENEFKAKGFDYVYAPHYDTANDHIHLLIRKRNDLGKNLRITPSDLIKLRSRYNQELKNIGIIRDISLRVQNQRTLDNIQKQTESLKYDNNIYQSILAKGTKENFNAYQYKATLSAVIEERINYLIIENHLKEHLNIKDNSFIAKIKFMSKSKGFNYVINNIESVKRTILYNEPKSINALLLTALEKDYYKTDKWKKDKKIDLTITDKNQEIINKLKNIKNEIITKDNANDIKKILNDIPKQLKANKEQKNIEQKLQELIISPDSKYKYSYTEKRKPQIDNLDIITEKKLESHKQRQSYFVPQLSDYDIQQKFFQEIVDLGKIKPTGLETAISSAFANHNTKIRFGHKKQNEICWYGQAGYVKNYKIKDSYLSWGVRNIKQDQNQTINYKKITKEELEEYKKRQEQEIINREKQKEKLYQETAIKQEQILKDAKNTGNSQYLRKKQIDDIKINNIKFDQNNNPLIPIRDINGKLWSVQTIYNNGKKPFAKDSMTRGNFYLINKDKIDNNKSIIIAEGFSTIASIYKSMDSKHQNNNFISCLNAGNMQKVVENIKSTHPTQQIILMADNDQKNLLKNLTNIGLDTANEIKEKYPDIKVIYPKFTDDEIKKEKLSDFNDLAVKRGIEETKAEIKKQLKENGVELEVERGMEIER